MGAAPIAGSRRREDVVVPRAPVSCSVCRRHRTLGSCDESGEIFICADCQADAKQFIEIQDSLFGPAGRERGLESEPSNESQRPEQP